MLTLQKGKHSSSRRSLLLLCFIPATLVMASILELDVFSIGKAAFLIFSGCAFILYRSDSRAFRKN